MALFGSSWLENYDPMKEYDTHISHRTYEEQDVKTVYDGGLGELREAHRNPAVQRVGPGCQDRHSHKPLQCVQTMQHRLWAPRTKRRVHKPHDIKGELRGLREAPYKSLRCRRQG